MPTDGASCTRSPRTWSRPEHGFANEIAKVGDGGDINVSNAKRGARPHISSSQLTLKRSQSPEPIELTSELRGDLDPHVRADSL